MSARNRCSFNRCGSRKKWDLGGGPLPEWHPPLFEDCSLAKRNVRHLFIVISALHAVNDRLVARVLGHRLHARQVLKARRRVPLEHDHHAALARLGWQTLVVRLNLKLEEQYQRINDCKLTTAERNLGKA